MMRGGDKAAFGVLFDRYYDLLHTFARHIVKDSSVAEDIIQRFAGLDREQGEALGLEVSMQMAREALPYADGFYLMTPFNRVALMERLIARLKTELLDAEG